MNILNNVNDTESGWTKRDLELIREIIEDGYDFLCHSIPNNPNHLIIRKVMKSQRSYLLRIEYVGDGDGAYQIIEGKIPEGSHLIETGIIDSDPNATKFDLFEFSKTLWDEAMFSSHYLIGDPNHVILQRCAYKYRTYLCTFQFIGDGDACHDSIIDQFM